MADALEGNGSPDRRRHDRAVVELSLEFRLDSPAPIDGSGTTFNLSAGGFAARISEDVVAGATGEFEVELERTDRVTVRGQVLRAGRNLAGVPVVAVQFVDVTPQMRAHLNDFVLMFNASIARK